ncbi:hypothetical protein [Novosphingobium sp. FKTRR1]|uniref:hypothetical protein n=1 Tax=Novosphingobium sp. FKTRR1 TaxID=2879118 RepID=UPI001CF0492E|nr:hypothetical protein [Novosphingobium sp. FKTRR1]
MNENDKGPTEKLTAENLTQEVYDAFAEIAKRRNMSVEDLFYHVVRETFWRLKRADAIKTIEGGKEGPQRPGPGSQPAQPQKPKP